MNLEGATREELISFVSSVSAERDEVANQRDEALKRCEHLEEQNAEL